MIARGYQRALLKREDPDQDLFAGSCDHRRRVVRLTRSQLPTGFEPNEHSH